MWHATPRPKDSLDPALFCQLVPESKSQSQRVPIFCKVGCLAIVVTDSHGDSHGDITVISMGAARKFSREGQKNIK